MAKYRDALPQLSGDLFLTDGGLETTLLFHQGIDLPEFAAFTVLNNDTGRRRLSDYFRSYAKIARDNGVGFILEGYTWRASSDWGRKIGYSDEDLERINIEAIELLKEIRDEMETDSSPMVISGCIGPRDDGYHIFRKMKSNEAEQYHATQIETFAGTDADMVTALTMNYVEEAVGIVRAANEAGLPVAISFTVETDGNLPSGDSLEEAIGRVDHLTRGGPAYYMINCAHPTHFEDAVASNAGWKERVRGVRANASCKSHAELDDSTELDDGNPGELGGQYKELRNLMPALNVLGGCCGTDHRHIEAICNACNE